jgi:hypothetical protein
MLSPVFVFFLPSLFPFLPLLPFDHSSVHPRCLSSGVPLLPLGSFTTVVFFFYHPCFTAVVPFYRPFLYHSRVYLKLPRVFCLQLSVLNKALLFTSVAVLPPFSLPRCLSTTVFFSTAFLSYYWGASALLTTAVFLFLSFVLLYYSRLLFPEVVFLTAVFFLTTCCLYSRCFFLFQYRLFSL